MAEFHRSVADGGSAGGSGATDDSDGAGVSVGPSGSSAAAEFYRSVIGGGSAGGSGATGDRDAAEVSVVGPSSSRDHQDLAGELPDAYRSVGREPREEAAGGRGGTSAGGSGSSRGAPYSSSSRSRSSRGALGRQVAPAASGAGAGYGIAATNVGFQMLQKVVTHMEIIGHM